MKFPLFVLTSGHSGSKSMAKMLSQHPKIHCNHERLNQGKHKGIIIPISANVAHGVTPPTEKFPSFVIDQINKEMKEVDGVWAESNWRTFNLVPKIIMAWPEAKFIHVIRDGRGSVAARHVHGHYYNPVSPHAHHSHQLHPLNGVLVGEVSRVEWSSMEPFEKLCWMWGYIQRTIIHELKDIPHIRMPIEQSDDQKYWNEIHKMLGLEIEPIEMVHVHKKNTSPANQYSAWSNRQKTIFERWCGSIMDNFYPGWREE